MDSLTTAQVLPISGCTAVFVHQPDSRVVLELLGPAAQLLTVSSDSRLDTEPLRGAWRGVRRDGGTVRQEWAVAAGRSPHEGQVTVYFENRHRLGGRSTTVRLHPVQLGAFWVAEAAGSFTHVTVTVGAHQSDLRLARVRGPVWV